MRAAHPFQGIRLVEIGSLARDSDERARRFRSRSGSSTGVRNVHGDRAQRGGDAVNNIALAAQIRRDAERYGRANRTDDAEMRSVIARDVAAMHRVADLVEQGQMKRAYQRAARMDTAARDGFSKRAWIQLSGGAAFGHTRWEDA